MTVTFSDLHAETGLRALDDPFSGKLYISGVDKITKDDVEVYALFSGKPSSESYPNASIWYQAVKDMLVSSYRQKASGLSIGGQAEQSKESIAEDDVEEREERRRPIKRKRAEDDVGEETEEEQNEAAEEAAKASESEKTWTICLVVSGDEEIIDMMKENLSRLSTLLNFVSSAEATSMRGGKRLRFRIAILSEHIDGEDIDDEHYYILCGII